MIIYDSIILSFPEDYQVIKNFPYEVLYASIEQMEAFTIPYGNYNILFKYILVI